jgi:hypothetical protein
MPSTLVPIAQIDFSGGVNAVSNPYLTGDKQVQRIRNLILDEHGSLRTRDGYSVVTTSPNLTNSPIIYRGVLNKANGTSIPFAIQNVSGTTQLFRTDTNPWTGIGTLTNPAILLPQSVTMVDTEIIARGNGATPVQFDGTSAPAITAQAGQTTPPGAAHIAFHLGSLWLWNTSTSTTALDGPSSLRMSDVNNPNSWPNANQAFVAKDDGQVGMGMATYTIAETGISPTQTLVLFKNYSTYQVVSVFGAANFSIQKVKSDMGCTAPRTIQFVSGFGIIRLTHKGFALFNGVDDRLISEEVRPYIYGRDDITGLNFNAIDRSWSVQSQNPPLYIAACPLTGNGLTRLFVYDLVRRAWSICDFPVDFSCLSLFSVPGSTPVIHAGTFGTGQIVSLFSGATSDNGVAITWSLRTRPFNLGSPSRYAFWRRMLLDFLYTPTEDVTVSNTLLGIGNPVSKTVTYGGTSTTSLWNIGAWDSMVWDTLNTVDGRQSVDILQTASAVTADISGSGPVRLRSIEIQARPKPLTNAEK